MNASRQRCVTLDSTSHVRYAAVFFLALFAQPSIANDLQSRLSKLDAIARDIRDVSADFQEKIYTAMLKKPLASQGTVFVKGKRTHWKTIKPTAVSLLTGDDHIAIYYPTRKTVEMYEMDQRLRSLAISPLPRLAMLRRNFTIEADKRSTKSSPPGTLLLRLIPKNKAVSEFVEELFVQVDERIGLSSQVEMIDADGDRTIITFTNIRTNVGITDEQVELRLPKDVTTVYPLQGRTENGSTAQRSPS